MCAAAGCCTHTHMLLLLGKRDGKREDEEREIYKELRRQKNCKAQSPVLTTVVHSTASTTYIADP